jgi:hypothetical protein
MPVLGSSSEALQSKFESLIHMTSGAPLCQVCGYLIADVLGWTGDALNV